jgi:hypothetical protein
MGIINITSEIRHGELKMFVTAEKGTHHSTVLSAVSKYRKELEQPNYVSSIPGMPLKTKPGEWCLPMYSGEWRRVGSNLEADTHIRKAFTSWPVPSYKD